MLVLIPQTAPESKTPNQKSYSILMNNMGIDQFVKIIETNQNDNSLIDSR